MKKTWKLSALLLLCPLGLLMAQTPDNPNIMTESGEPMQQDAPVDDIVEKRMITEKRVLPYDHIRESDVFWEKKVWRVIDTREKMNLPFRYPKRPFLNILLDAARSSELTVYDGEYDDFSKPLSIHDVEDLLYSEEVIETIDPETYATSYDTVRNELNWMEVKRYRVKEVWFFDKETSTLQVRILGIAPVLDVVDDNGNYRGERPLFWVYYPNARNVLAKEQVFNFWNDASPMSWEDLMEMRFFSSYIYKQSNVHDRRIQDYASGIDLLMESDRVKSALFNFEHDLWSY